MELKVFLFVCFVLGTIQTQPINGSSSSYNHAHCIKMTPEKEAEIQEMIDKIGDFLTKLTQQHEDFDIRLIQFDIEGHFDGEVEEKQTTVQININDCSDSNAEATPEAKSYSEAISEANSNSDATSEANSNSDATSEANSNSDATSEANSNSDATSEGNSNSDATSEANSNSDAISEANGNTKATSEANGNSDAPSEANGNTKATSEANGNSDATSEANGNTKATSEANGNSDATSEANGNTKATSETNSNIKTNSEAKTIAVEFDFGPQIMLMRLEPNGMELIRVLEKKRGKKLDPLLVYVQTERGKEKYMFLNK